MYPEIVQTDASGYKAVDYSRLTPVLVEAIKEQQKQIAELSFQVDKLSSENQQLKMLGSEVAELKKMVRALSVKQ